MAATAWDMVSEKRKPSNSSYDNLSRSSSTNPNSNPNPKQSRERERDEPLVPESIKPGAKFGGFGFGRQGEKVAEERGWKISRPMETLPRMSGPFPFPSLSASRIVPLYILFIR